MKEVKEFGQIIVNRYRSSMPTVVKSEEIEIDYILQQSHGKFFEDFIPTRIPSRMYEAIRVSTDGLSFKLIDKNQRDLLSCVNGNFTNYNDIEYFEITGTYSKLEHRGFLTYLFEILVYEYDYHVLSDGQHSSPGSKEFWQAQIKRTKFSIYRLNIKTSYKRKAHRFQQKEIWGEPKKVNFYISSFIEEDESEGDGEREFEDMDLLNAEVEALDEIITADDFTYEDLNPVSRNQEISFEDIRLVAQKWKEET